MAKKSDTVDGRLSELAKTRLASKAIKRSTRKPVPLSDGTVGEQYAFIKYSMSYGNDYDAGMYKEQKQMEKLLDEFVIAYKPKSYRIINAQIVYLGVDNLIYMTGGILHVLHIGYQV